MDNDPSPSDTLILKEIEEKNQEIEKLIEEIINLINNLLED